MVMKQRVLYSIIIMLLSSVSAHALQQQLLVAQELHTKREVKQLYGTQYVVQESDLVQNILNFYTSEYGAVAIKNKIEQERLRSMALEFVHSCVKRQLRVERSRDALSEKAAAYAEKISLQLRKEDVVEKLVLLRDILENQRLSEEMKNILVLSVDTVLAKLLTLINTKLAYDAAASAIMRAQMPETKESI